MTGAIERVCLAHLQIPFKEPFRISGGEVAIKDAILVVAETADGQAGVGESSPMAPGFGYSSDTPDQCWDELCDQIAAFARDVGEISTRVLGLAFGANTLVIVVLQLVVLQRIEGRRRTRVIAVMSVVWAGSWLLLGLAGLVPGTVGASVLVAGCAAVFAFGETLLQPTIPALVNDLAPDHLRGRYNALSSGSFQLAAVIAPPISGVLIGRALGEVYIGLLVVGCLVCGLLAVVRLEPRLDPRVNGVRERRTPGEGELTAPATAPVVE